MGKVMGDWKAGPRVVIVGGGFGGLYCARALAREPVRMTLVDRKNHHVFQPLLYQVATAALSPGDIASPIRSILRRFPNVEVLLGEVVGFELDQGHVLLKDGGRLEYDYLVVAAGAQHSYFGHGEWESLAPGLKTIEDALEIRRRVLLAYEVAERQAALGKDPGPLNFVIVGAGPTGVELAGAIAEIAARTLAKDFRMIQTKRSRVLLLEGGPCVLATYPEDLSRKAEEQLRGLGVEVRTSAMVTGVEKDQIRVGNEIVPATLTVWAAGVAASGLGRLLSAETDRAGRIPVSNDCSLPQHPEVFVVGDLALFKDEQEKPLPGVAQVAIQQGRAVAKNIGRELKGQPRRPFHYKDLGSLATIGRAAAVADIFGIHLSGLVAWLVWLFIHILWLIGFRNRVLVMVNWTWSYFAWQRGPRLITERDA
ncbi:MAG TPA: NAD(P)/FAD-dependent oxidoreductase [Terriglobales bacterium]|nr:NAD(P)/FAD-dependent oxidoreductase [Terriglobales bacterium]